MKLWAPGSAGVDIPGLNSTFPFDAVVDPSAGAGSGAIYSSLVSALAAGHRSIYVRSGTYNEAVTISANNTTIVGENRGSTSGAYGALFQQTMTISADYVRLESLIVGPATGNGFAITSGKGNYSRLVDCAAASPPGQGFSWGLCYDLLLFGCRAFGDITNGNGFFQESDATTGAALAVTLQNCRARYMGGWGFYVEGDRSSGTGTRYANLIDCEAYHCGKGWVSGGFFIGPRNNVDLVACKAASCGDSGSGRTSSGFRFVTPSTSSPSILQKAIGCEAVDNYGVGFNLDLASSRVILLGNRARNNTTDYVNAGSCPGYAAGTPAAPFLNFAG